MKFKHKILMGPLLTAVAFVLLFGVTLLASNRSSRTITRIQDEFFHALELSHDLEVDLLTSNHLMTDAFINGNEESLAEAEDVAARFRRTIEECREVPELSAQLQPLLGEYDAWFDLAQRTARTTVEEATENDLDFDEQFIIDIQRKNQAYDTLKAHLEQVVDQNNERLEEAIGQTRTMIVRSRRTMNILSLVFLGLLFFLSIGVITSVLRPVHRMGRMTKAIAGGDLDMKLDYESRDELGELADSFRDMQAALIREFARREKAEAELISAQGQIIQSEKMAALGKLVAGLAHELNTPLGTLASSADVADRSRRIIHDRVEDEKQVSLREDPRFKRALTALDEGVANMTTASARIDELVTGLRAFSQLDKAEFQRTDLNDGLRATVDLIANQVPGEVTLEVDLGEVEPILGFPAQLNQLFLGLIRHAVSDVTPPGRVRVSSAMEETTVVVTVADDGCGYEPEALKALFNPGFGTGAGRVRMDWGLVTCHRIVDRHGGTLDTASRPGEGTTYTIRIPVRTTPPEASDPSAV